MREEIKARSKFGCPLKQIFAEIPDIYTTDVSYNTACMGILG
jgi:hypothetical protein